jgi:hypothetical protein
MQLVRLLLTRYFLLVTLGESIWVILYWITLVIKNINVFWLYCAFIVKMWSKRNWKYCSNTLNEECGMEFFNLRQSSQFRWIRVGYFWIIINMNLRAEVLMKFINVICAGHKKIAIVEFKYSLCNIRTGFIEKHGRWWVVTMTNNAQN